MTLIRCLPKITIKDITITTNNEIKRIREEEQIAKEQWMETYQSKCEDQKQDFQKRVREEMVKERNREIESIINKLGDETHDT